MNRIKNVLNYAIRFILALKPPLTTTDSRPCPAVNSDFKEQDFAVYHFTSFATHLGHQCPSGGV